MDQTPTKQVPLEEEDRGRGKRVKKDKKVFSSETKSAKELQKETVENVKKSIRSSRKTLFKAEQAVLQELDIENAENMIEKSDQSCHAVKIRFIEKKKLAIVLEKSTQTEETIKTMEETDERLQKLERSLKELTTASSVQNSNTAQNEILESLLMLKEGQYKLLELAEKSSQNESEQLQRNSNSSMKSIVAGIPIDETSLLEAKNCLNVKDCLKYLILGYWDPEDYKFVGCTKPDGINDEEFILVTIRHSLDILKVAKELQNDNDLPISRLSLEEWTCEKVKQLIRKTINSKRYSIKQKRDAAAITSKHD